MFKLKTFFVLAFICLFALPASGFMPDDEELTLLMQKSYGPLSSWEAEMTFSEYPDASVHIWYARGKWRQQWKTGDKATAVGINGNVTGACTAEDFALSPLFVWMVPNPVVTWAEWGVDATVRNFAFCDGHPCYMIGSDPGDATSPTVHLNNEDMSPILVRYNSPAGLTSVSYTDYRTMGGFRLPQKVTVTIGGDLILEAKVKWIAVNRADGEELYSRDALDSAPCAAPGTPFDILRDSFHYPTSQ